MDKSCEVIDLCVKSEKSDDTSTTIPFEANSNADARLPETEENKICSTDCPSKREYTEQWVSEQNTIIPPSSKMPCIESSFVRTPALETQPQDIVGTIPTEITELVNNECAIKLINHLVIYAFNKITEADLHRKLISVTPDIDPQINYRSKIGFRCVYERCVVLFYEALLDLTEILHKLSPPHLEIVILWMYNTVENISRAHGVDSSFLRNEKYIETLLRDFSSSQSEIPNPENIFFNIYRKMQPTEVTVGTQLQTASEGPPKKKGRQRKPRTKKDNQLAILQRISK